MRDHFNKALIAISHNKNFVFLTGDLGFNALEGLSLKMKERFINAGISEQNMISIAAALAKQDFECWAYSIAPFCYARPFEQIRNDVCFHNLPVKIVGNGGGYAYGVMGPTHHAIEDYGILSTLPNLKSYVPAFNEDIPEIIDDLRNYKGPAYLRLGADNSPTTWTPQKYAPWRKIINGEGFPIIINGPLSGSVIQDILNIKEELRPQVWVVSEFPINQNKIPMKLLKKINDEKNLMILEEHTLTGGLGQQLIYSLVNQYSVTLNNITHLYAKKHVYDSYGSQKFLRKLSGLDPKSIMDAIHSLL
jgi:transketolase